MRKEIFSECLQTGLDVRLVQATSRGFEETVLYSKGMPMAEEDVTVTQSALNEKYEEYEEEEEYLDETQVYLRSKFYESWLWMDVNLPSQVDKDG